MLTYLDVVFKWPEENLSFLAGDKFKEIAKLKLQYKPTGSANTDFMEVKEPARPFYVIWNIWVQEFY